MFWYRPWHSFVIEVDTLIELALQLSNQENYWCSAEQDLISFVATP